MTCGKSWKSQLTILLVCGSINIVHAVALPKLQPLTKSTTKKKNTFKNKIRRRPVVDDSPHWDYRLTMTPYLEYIGGSPEQAKRIGNKGTFYYNYGSWRFYSEGFFEADEANSAETRLSERTSALQEASIEYRVGSYFIKAGTQALRWSEAWTMPSLDGWTARRFNRLFFDSLSEQLIHPTGVLLNWNTSNSVVEFFQNFRPATSIYPEQIPKEKSSWESEWGVHARYRMNSGVDVEVMFFDKTDKYLYGASANYATDFVVPKLEIGKDSKDSQFMILGLDIFYGQFSLIPRLTFYKTKPLLSLVNTDAASGSNSNLTIRWDNSATWAETQAFYDSVMEAQFYSLRVGHRLGKGFEFSCFAQDYSGAENTLFGLYEKMTGSNFVLGTKLALSL
jgi:hypothetical protein